MNYPSKFLEDAVMAFASLPGIGKKTALRLVLHLLQQDKDKVDEFMQAISKMRHQLKHCKKCHNISDQELCNICANPSRDPSLICVVENLRDLIQIENTGTYKGLYHVLGGIINPLEGIGPEQLNIQSLIQRSKEKEVKELIMAISPTIEGDTTIFYIARLAQRPKLKISVLARGISFGGELEYADEITLSRSIKARRPYGQT